jgi:hypothetical protein
MTMRRETELLRMLRSSDDFSDSLSGHERTRHSKSLFIKANRIIYISGACVTIGSPGAAAAAYSRPPLRIAPK